MDSIFLTFFNVPYKEAAIGGVVLKKVFLKISQNSQENFYAGVACFY